MTVAMHTPAAHDHALTFDVEEFFQVEAARRSGVCFEDWEGYESRIERPMDAILEMLADRGIRATFFMLGWVARPKDVRPIRRGFFPSILTGILLYVTFASD